MAIAKDFAELLPSRQAAAEPDDRPLYYLWTFDPHTNEVHIEHNESKHPAHHVTHEEVAPHVKNPVHGNAYSIKGGWRITEMDEGAKEKAADPFITRKVEHALARKHPPQTLPTGFLSSVEDTEALPRIRYHGSP